MNQKTLDSFDGNELAAKVFLDRYAFRNELTWEDCISRVLSGLYELPQFRELVSYRDDNALEEILYKKQFIPGGRILNVVGTGKQNTLYNCLTLPRPEDSIEGIMKTGTELALSLKSGAGVGIRLDSLRPKNSKVKTSQGKSSGSVKFGSIYNEICSVINQGGSRRGALLLGHRMNHPDIEDFIRAKENLGNWNNCNITVYAKNEEIIDDRKTFNLICEQAWKTGEPGILFMDKAQEIYNEAAKNLSSEIPEFEGVNACSEVLLPPYGCCLLGSLNLDRLQKLESINKVAKFGIIFLNLCHLYARKFNLYPLPESASVVQKTNKIGLGVMGLAHHFIYRDIIYGSQESLDRIDEIWTELKIGAKKGAYISRECVNIKNMDLLACPPTGTTSILANTSNGIEPVFRKQFKRTDRLGEHLCFDKYANHDYMVDSTEINPIDRVKVQARIQSHLDNAISSTVNLPINATIDDVKNIYLKAMELGCVSITVYRDGCREGVLTEVSKESSRIVQSKEQVINSEDSRTDVRPGQESIKSLDRPFSRPQKLLGQTFKYSFGGRNVYVTVNVNGDGEPIEVFVSSPGINEQWSKACTILFSELLQLGYDPRKMIEKLERIEHGVPAYIKEAIIKSEPAAISHALRVMIDDMEPESLAPKVSHDSSYSIKLIKVNLPKCDKCGGTIIVTGRCKTCSSCGWSSC